MPSLRDRILDAFEWEPDDGTLGSVVDADGLADELSLANDGGESIRDAIALFDRDFLTRFTHGSAAIEGSTLTPMQTELVLEGEFLPRDDRQLADMFAARGIAEGYGYAMRGLAEGRPLDSGLVKDVHERMALDCQPAVRGTFRRVPVYIRGSRTAPPDPIDVPDLVDLLLWAHGRSAQHPLVRAAAFHAMFENVHPFQDGNGRCGRLLLCRELVAGGYPPVAIRSDEREEYLASLEAWQCERDGAPFVRMLTACVAREAGARISAIEKTRAASERSGGGASDRGSR
ncbi:MAG: Fic family protein [Coriobacteriaceae bacterium]|nr:Fic family protein [Coriobacteriaceae bacterium]MCI6844084.1 Fic family protein [Coriobacteriaceae bacterium]MDD7585303.1 Fic family protein [Coriobacteriaceae bacterium]